MTHTSTEFTIFIKDPDATLPYTFDWTDWLGDTETIVARTTTVQTGLTRVGTDLAAPKTTTVTVSGGRVGRDYKISDKITTTPSGLIDARTMIIRVRQR